MNPEEPINMTLSIKRQMVWDSVPCPRVPEMLPAMGLVLGSQEVIDMEHRASHRRLQRLAPIYPYVLMTSALAGEVIGRAILEDQGMEPSDEDLERYVAVVQAGVMAVLSNLADMDLVGIGGGYGSGLLG